MDKLIKDKPNLNLSQEDIKNLFSNKELLDLKGGDEKYNLFHLEEWCF